jgi:membrane protein
MVEKELFPYLVSGLLFTLIIWYVPNIRVRLRAALTGGFFSGALWQLSNWAFTRFVVGAGRASARDVLFAGFAALPLFLAWIYASWIIVLFGAELGYVVQHVGVMEWRELERIYGGSLRRFVGVRAVLGIVRDTDAKAEAASLRDLAREMKVPEPVIRDVLRPLVSENILTRSTIGEERYRPSRDPGDVTLAELLHLFEGQQALPEKLISADVFGQDVERLLHQIDSSLEAGVGGRSLRDAAAMTRQQGSRNRV